MLTTMVANGHEKSRLTTSEQPQKGRKCVHYLAPVNTYTPYSYH